MFNDTKLKKLRDERYRDPELQDQLSASGNYFAFCEGFDFGLELSMISDMEYLIEVLEFTTNATEQLYNPNKQLVDSLDPSFYHTLTYDGDVELIEKTENARNLLETLKKKYKITSSSV